MVPETGAITLNACIDITCSYCSKNIANPWWFMHLHFCQRPPETEAENRIHPPPQVHGGDATDQHILPKVYLTNAQPDDPSDRSTGLVYHTGAGSKHGELSCHSVHMEPFSMTHNMSHCAFNPLSIHYILRDHPNIHELTNHILHSVAGTRPAVAGCSRKDVVPLVRNGSCVTNRHNRKFSQDNFDGDDVENRILAVKLIHNPRTDRLQPTCDGIMCIIAIIAIMSIIIIQLS